MKKKVYAVATYYYDTEGNHYYTQLISGIKHKKSAYACMYKRIRKHIDGTSIIRLVNENADVIEIEWSDDRKVKIELIELW